MVSIEEKILYEINWRTEEISIIKTVPFLFSVSKKQKEVLKKYVIPTFYSLWEGFFVECFSIYIREINKLKLSREQLNINMLVHSIDIKCDLRNGRVDFDKKIDFVKNILEHTDKEIELPVIVPTESNVNYKVTNAILRRFNLCQLPQVPFEKDLNKLLLLRNKIAHGENNIPVDQKMIDEASLVVISSMHEVAEKVLSGYKSKSYLELISS
jgi:hypothetical protein